MKKTIELLTAGGLVIVLANRIEAAPRKLLLGGVLTESVKKIGAEFSHKTSIKVARLEPLKQVAY